ncbi:hypothetical protein DPMN_163158 [Dreissena polymorpha]|uniref:Signal recognition particle SRP72 subunit RNA-binding domain-containing protein n=1 Tax=Dreissena polymorpha TaxID=45954 RepID=A0A9D4ISJ5_DREPO|nr:hypothetical protein DPMN_163158 [Dreissena polymorpha]
MALIFNRKNLVFSLIFLAKLPKNYNPDVTPDPERWLPRRERSYYRGKRKDKKKDIGVYSSPVVDLSMSYW